MLNWIYNLTAKLRQKLSEKGQGMVEYAMILAAVAIIAVVVIWGTGGEKEQTLESTVKQSFTNANTAVERANEKIEQNTPAKSGS